jgi:hypothetical protein
MLNFDWLSGVSPAAAKGVFLVLFVVIGCLVLAVPREEIYAGVEHPRWWHNLKIWAILVLSMIFTTYLAF